MCVLERLEADAPAGAGGTALEASIPDVEAAVALYDWSDETDRSAGPRVSTLRARTAGRDDPPAQDVDDRRARDHDGAAALAVLASHPDRSLDEDVALREEHDRRVDRRAESVQLDAAPDVDGGEVINAVVVGVLAEQREVVVARRAHAQRAVAAVRAAAERLA